MLSFIQKYISSGSERSVKAKKNIIASFLNKGVAIIISLLIVPITINYLNSEQYGIWLTLSSTVAWIAYFDIGLGHGFRNKFAEAKANGDPILARKYVSTTYAILGIIFGAILILVLIINPFLDWASLLKVSAPNDLLQKVVSILVFGVSISFVLNVATIMLSADQRPALASIITTIGQAVALLVIYILTLSTSGDMKLIAIALSWVPCLVVFICSIYLFRHQYAEYSPSRKFVDFSLVRDIVVLGGKFFVIQISMLVIFQMINIILSRVCGPESVTVYNVTYKYFSVSLMVFNIILAPFWSAFTDAYTRQDFNWMKQIRKKLITTWALVVVVNLGLLLISPLFFKIWLKDSVTIPWSVSIAMCIYISILSYSTMYMTLLNGIGKVTVQMIIYVVCALVSVPLSFYLCGVYGIVGILIVFSAVYLIQSIFARRQLSLLLNGKASGLWDK